MTISAHPQSINRFYTLALALLLTWALMPWFTPVNAEQFSELNVWLAWLACMAVVNLPLLLLEGALARRMKQSPLNALPPLTREADTKPLWRSLGWLALLWQVLISSGLLVSGLWLTLAGGVSLLGLFAAGSGFTILNIAAGGLLFIASVYFLRPSVWIGAALIILTAILGAVLPEPAHTYESARAYLPWHWHGFRLADWKIALSSALMATGLGVGLYWQQFAQDSADDSSKSLTAPVKQHVLVLWLLQILAGVCYVALHGIHRQIGAVDLSFGIAQILMAGFLAANVLRQIRHHKAWLAAAVLLWVGGIAFALFSNRIYIEFLDSLGLLTALGFTIFVGWKMKISHMRKALNFNSEGIYNLWRIAVRVLIPLAIIAALLGVWTQGFEVQQYYQSP